MGSTAGLAEAAAGFSGVPWPPITTYAGPIQDLEPGEFPEGTVSYFDPPYSGHPEAGDRTGYGHAFPIETLLEVVRAHDESGADVVISMDRPLTGELGSGWHSADITHCGSRNRKRRGRPGCDAEGRFDEYITMNFQSRKRTLVAVSRLPADVLARREAQAAERETVSQASASVRTAAEYSGEQLSLLGGEAP